MKNGSSYISRGILVLVVSLVVGEILSLVVGLRYDRFVRISPVITILDSLFLGVGILITLYFIRQLTPQSRRIFPVLALSFGLILGMGIIAFIGFLLYDPTPFIYSENLTVTYLLINLLFFMSINLIVSGFTIFQQTVMEKEKALHEETVLKTQMELKLLSSKVNPHFLFNSLNLMVSLLKTPDKAESALINLAEIMRYHLDFGESQTVALSAEIGMVEKYLSIQQMRFGEKLSYRIECEVEGDIPPMIIQPLVENCIKHNIDITDHLQIHLKVIRDLEYLIITVLDSNASLCPEMLDRGIGLTVTAKRIEYLGGTFLITNGGIEISIKS